MNKHEQMGFGPGRGYTSPEGDLLLPDGRPDGKNLESGRTGTFKHNSERATQIADDVLIQQSLEARLNSGEAHVLNEQARLAVYGSDGRTDGIVDPSTGEPITEPIKGRVNEILEDDRLEKSAAKRRQKAADYETELLGLVDEGLELTQAKLVMDCREADRTKEIDLISNYMHQGMTADQARAKAAKAYKFKDQKRLDLIQKNGILSADEYNNFLNGPDDTPDTDDGFDEATRMNTQRDLDALNTLRTGMEDARTEYARLSASRGRRHNFRRGGDYSEENIAEARARYEAASVAIIHHEARMALNAGVELDVLNEYAESFGIGEAERMANVVERERLIATEQHELVPGGAGLDIRGNRLTQEVQPRTSLQRVANRFYRWWGRQADERFLSTATVKKAAAMGAIGGGAGFVVGIPAALAGTILLGPIAGGAAGAFAATRVARSFMAHRINQRGRDATYVDRLSGQISEAANDGNVGAIGDMIDGQTASEVQNNRRRLRNSVAAAAIGGTIGAVGADQLFGNDNGGSKSENTGSQVGGFDIPELPGGLGQIDTADADTGGAEAGDESLGDINPEAEKPEPVELSLGQSGDTIWGETASYMDQHGYDGSNNADVQKATQAILDHNGLTWEDARSLPVGFKFELPPDVLDEMTKKK